MKYRLPAFAAAAVLFLALLPACERIDRNMWENPAFRPQEAPVRLPPKDSIPTKGKEHVPSPAEAVKLQNPVKPMEGSLARGRELFGIFCFPCHGATGKGDGPVGKKFVPEPADLREGSPASKLPDGILFVIVTNGIGAMPAFKADLSPVERWQVIAHVRTLR